MFEVRGCVPHTTILWLSRWGEAAVRRRYPVNFGKCLKHFGDALASGTGARR